MRIRHLLICSAFAAAAILAGCGGGDDGSVSQQKILSGIAAKGPVAGGTVTVFAIDGAGNTGNVLGSTTTATDGYYSLVIGPYTGVILIELSGGTYTDEATGLAVGNNVLRAVTEFPGNPVVAITPLTDLAVQKAGTLTPANIAMANDLISTMIGGIDIIATLPSDALAPPPAAATGRQLDYALALAALSQLVADQLAYNSIDDALNAISTDLADNQLDVSGSALNSALVQFLGSANNRTGLMVGTTNLDQALGDATNRPIGTDASSVTIALALSNQLSSGPDGTYYIQAGMVQVADTDGNPVANRQVFLNLWPLNYYHGYWGRDNITGTCQVNYTNWPAGSCANSYQQPNEDTDMDRQLDAGEDVGPMGNPDGFLTPAASGGGTVVPYATTDENGQANFEVFYLKNNAAWIKDRLTASTSALMIDNQASMEWILAVPTADADLCDTVNGPHDSPYGFVPECPVP